MVIATLTLARNLNKRLILQLYTWIHSLTHSHTRTHTAHTRVEYFSLHSKIYRRAVNCWLPQHPRIPDVPRAV